MSTTPLRHPRRARRTALLAVLIAGAAASAVQAALPAGSLTANPSFETGTAGWMGYQATLLRVAASDAPDGAYVARATYTSGGYYTIDDDPNTVTSSVAGATYAGQAWVKSASASATGKVVYLRVRERAASGAVVKEWSSPAVRLGATFTRLNVSAVAVKSGDQVDIRVSQNPAATGDAFYVDGITLTGPGAAATPPPPAPSATPPPADVTPPAVGLTAPTQGAALQGAVPITVTATDDVGVDRVEFYINGQLRWTERYAPYKFGTAGTWDTTQDPNGSYTVEARAFDAAGNATSARVSVTVANPPPPSPSGTAAGTAERYPFDPSFAFNRPIPAGVPSDARSDAVISQLVENMHLSKATLSDESDVPTVYVAAATDPWYTTSVGGRSVRFRVPDTAVIGGGVDAPMVIQDPNHPDYGASTELRLWQASLNRTSHTISSSGSGLFHYNNDGALFGGQASLGQPFLGWGTGSGLTITAGLIRPDEVRAGEIRHAIRFSYSNSDFNNQFRAPALRTDQPNGATTRNPATAMTMGMRLQLDPAVDCSTRTVPGVSAASPETRLLRIICVALQRYGMIAVDGTADRGLVMMMENNATANWGGIVGFERYGSYSHIIRDLTTPSDGLTRDANSGIPWNRMRVLSTSTFG